MNNLIYMTTTELGWEENWLVLCDKNGNPITSFNQAIAYVREHFHKMNVGLSTKGQMQMGNASWDNF